MTTRKSHLAFVPAFSAGCLIVALAGCAGAARPQPGSLAAIKESQFMPIYQQCLQDNAPLRPTRTSALMLNEVAKACMQAAKRAVK